MKQDDSGDFRVLYVEPDDDRATLMQALSGKKKPAVILLADQARLFRHPEDFHDLKHVKRQLDVPILFVIPESEHLMQMAARHGFPAYPSMDALSDALMVGNAVRQRRPMVSSRSTEPVAPYRKAKPLSPTLEDEEVTSEDEEITPDWIMDVGIAPGQTRNGAGITLNQTTNGVGIAPHQTTNGAGAAPNQATNGAGPVSARPQPQISQPLPQIPPELPRPRLQPARRRSLIALALLMLIALLVAGLGSFMVFFRGSALQTPAAAAPPIVGHVAFLNSEQVSESSTQGIDDEVLIDLSNIPAPATQKSYYAWLLGDHIQSDMMVTFLGALPVNKGHATLLYRGDAAHTNLLLTFSRFLVTEENAGMTPVAPSPDQGTWRYYGEFSQEKVHGYSFLDHLRHLLAADPDLDERELPGGLNTWMFTNTSKLLEWTTSMREPWEDNRDIGFVRRQSTRVLDYLDGVSFVSQDLPPNTPVLVDARQGSIGLLQVAGPNQNPPSYLTHVVQHLNGLLQAGKFSPPLRTQATQIVSGLDNIQRWLEQVRSDARQIMGMTDAQLRQPAALTLINDMISNVSNAYAGQPDPITGQVHEGVSWIHEHMQALASLDISPYSAPASSSPQLITWIGDIFVPKSGLAYQLHAAQEVY